MCGQLAHDDPFVGRSKPVRSDDIRRVHRDEKEGQNLRAPLPQLAAGPPRFCGAGALRSHAGDGGNFHVEVPSRGPVRRCCEQ